MDISMDNVFETMNREMVSKPQTLREALAGTSHIIKEIRTNDLDMKEFLFTLGCYEGEEVTIISVLSGNLVINVKDARYSIDKELASAILV